MSKEEKDASVNKENQSKEYVPPKTDTSTGEKTISPQVVISLILLFIFAIFAIVNTQEVSVNFLFMNLDAPLIIVLLGSFILGALTTALTGWQRRRKKSKK
ncbi:LapA family protein [Isachenkonia alkalipeptolytica]|uniref:DUF1049 domain-containing protein n=1 Tax=Isachenkonia alkalipeptolytica TaxID=2565777 RepID=A0AA44BE23_9CLOT|nr:lipopolysaccharide assembly protein LapA domain-containing protein [Isachenkonia alkalipeptolytica]NBG88572.1 DUF1049 domain-containing protein [Isachenkonia alkalipeptolytica]